MEKNSILPLRVGRPRDSPRWFDPRDRPWLYDQGIDLKSSGPYVHYQYKPLADREIRGLYIEPDNQLDAPIHCALRHGPIQWAGDFDPYMTLSYCWGGSHLDKLIRCDGKSIRVTSNLEMALRYIRQRQDVITRDLYAEPRQPNVQVPIWIDAICIDQANTAERTHQVRQMAEVYTNSSRLIVWLGVPHESVTPYTQQRRGTELYDKLRRGGILKSPWFSRRWVIEEYGLTPIHSRFFLFGSFWFRGFQIHTAFRSEMGKLQRALAQYDMFGFDPSNSLLYNLYQFEDAACSKAHDLIYSLLPLSFGSLEIGSIKIDYSQRIEDVFVDVARSIIQTENTRVDRLLPLLAVASAKNARGASGELPSWVPDWRIASRYMLEEHQSTVEGLLDDFRSENFYPKSAIVQNGSVSKGLKAVEGRRLLLKGRLMKPCFPPAHRQYITERYARWTTYSGSRGDQSCWTCRFFNIWERLASSAERNILEITNAETQALFIIPDSDVVFLLSRCPEVSPDTFTLACCLKVTTAVVRADEYKDFLHAREEFFGKLDHITLL